MYTICINVCVECICHVWIVVYIHIYAKDFDTENSGRCMHLYAQMKSGLNMKSWNGGGQRLSSFDLITQKWSISFCKIRLCLFGLWVGLSWWLWLQRQRIRRRRRRCRSMRRPLFIITYSKGFIVRAVIFRRRFYSVLLAASEAREWWSIFSKKKHKGTSRSTMCSKILLGILVTIIIDEAFCTTLRSTLSEKPCLG